MTDDGFRELPLPLLCGCASCQYIASMEDDPARKFCLASTCKKAISPIEEKLIAVLKDGGPLTRDQIVQKLSSHRTTVYDGLNKLIKRNEVKKYPFYQAERSRGRPQVLFCIVGRDDQ